MANIALDNLMKITKVLNQKGTFVRASTTLGDAIPQAGIGTYQLFDQCVLELNILKQSTKALENSFLDIASLDNADQNVDVSSISGQANRKSSVGANQVRGGVSGDTNTRPAMVNGTTGHKMSEDALFTVLQSICFLLMTINTDSATSDGSIAATLTA